MFDLDGTLVDSLDDIALHLNAMLADRGLPTRAREDIQAWVGHGAEQLVRRAVEDPAQVPEALATFRALYRARPVVHTRIYDGLATVLDRIAPGRILAVLSNKPHALTVTVVEAVLGRWPFAVVVGQRIGHPHKPDPAALREVMTALAVEPSASVMVGDSEVDLATARAAGVASVAVSWGLRSLPILEAAQPDHLVHTPAELGALFA